MAAPWGKIRAEWLKGNATHQQLADKYHLSVKTIQNRAYKEGWKNEKGIIREKTEEKTRERIVRAHEEQLERLIMANERMAKALMDLTQEIEKNPMILLGMKNDGKLADSISKAIQTTTMTQRDLFKLPTLDQDMARKAEAQRKREAKAKMVFEREKWEAEKARDNAEPDQEIWQIITPEGVTVDG